MKAWLQFKNKFEAFEVRERALLLGACLAAVYLMWSLIFVGPNAKAVKLAKARERVALQNISTAEAEMTVLEKLASKDPNIQLKLELEDLQSQLTRLDDKLSELSAGLITAEQLPQVLHQLVASSEGLTLRAIHTLPVSEIELTDSEFATGSEPQIGTEVSADMINIYRHGVSLTLEGDYATVYRYLKLMENSDWIFYWDSIDYKVTGYPKALVKIHVFTLSSEKGMFNG